MRPADDTNEEEKGRGGRMNTRGRSPITTTMAKGAVRSAKKAAAAAVDGAAAEEDDKMNVQAEEAQESREPVLLGPPPRGLYECDYCRADLTRAPRARCATCPDFDLCLDCLATSDHTEMCKSRREFQRMHRKQTQPAKPETGKKKKGRAGRKKAEEEEEDDPSILGYYYQGQWIPFFRHEASHGYVVADSTRYMLFPPFRGVKREMTGEKLDLEGEKKSGGEAMDVDAPGEVTDEAASKTKTEPSEKESSEDNALSAEIEDAKSDSAEDDKAKDTNEPAENIESSDIAGPKDDAQKDANSDVKMEDADEDTAVKEEPSMEEPSAKAEGNDVPSKEQPSKDTASQTKQPSKEQPKMAQFTLADDIRNIWTIEEDLRLLDGILTCGLGNWPEISEHVNGGNGDTPVGTVGGKTDKMCMERYLDDFLGRYGHILPPYTMVPIEEEEKEGDSDVECIGVSLPTSERKRLRRSYPASEEEDGPGFKKTRFRVVPTEDFGEAWPHRYVPNVPGVKHGDEVARDLWYRSEQSFVRQCTNAASKLDVDKIRQEFIEKKALGLEGYEANVLPPRIEDLKNYPGSELAGYMPRREDFDVEHDNDAEHLIADMEFAAEDSAADKDLKVEVIKIFNSKLDEREKRKKFILEKKLMNYRENQEKFQKLPADERHLIHRMRLFERFHSTEEHKTFVDNILKAKRLRKEIAKLQTYRRLGITSLADAEKYELDKSRREYHKMAWLKKEAETKKAEADAARQAKENASDLSMHGLDGGIGAAANQSLGVWKQYNQDSPSKRRRLNEGGDGELEATTLQSEPQPTEEAKPADSESAEEDQKPAAETFTLEDKPGHEMLSLKEKELCMRLQLLPQHYLAVKKALISESLAAGIMGKGQKGKTFVTVDVSKSNDIIDFVLKAGWISSRPTIKPVVKEESKV